MAEGGFRLPGSTYEELKSVIVAYGTRDVASNPGDVGKLDSVHRSSATRTNGFLVEVGVLRGEREKLVTPRGRELALALENADEERIRRIWRQVVSTSEFLQNVLSAVKIRQGIPYETVQAYIAQSAGQPRNKPVMIGSSTVIEVLKEANLLREEESGRIFAVHEIPTPDFILDIPDEVTREAEPVRPKEEAAPVIDEEPPETDDEAPEKQETPLKVEEPLDEAVDVAVKVHLHVRCEAGELDEVSPKLMDLIKTLKGAAPELAVHEKIRTEEVRTEEVRTEDIRSGETTGDALDLETGLESEEDDYEEDDHEESKYDESVLDDFFSREHDEDWRSGSSGRSYRDPGY